MKKSILEKELNWKGSSIMQLITASVLILRASRYSLIDDKTGEIIKGCKFTYVNSFEPEIDKQNSRGLEIMTGNMPYEAYDGFISLPAWFNLTYEVSVNSRGKPILKPIKFEFIEGYTNSK